MAADLVLRLIFFVQNEFLIHPQILAHVPQRLVGHRQFAHVVAPCIIPSAPARVWLPCNHADGAVLLAPREGLRRYLEGDTLARLPEAGRELMREEQRVI